MKNFTSILLSIAFFLTAEIVPGSKIYACGSNKSCCKMMNKKGSKSKCCCYKIGQKQGTCNKNQKKSGNCNGKDCPCPQIGSNIQFGNIPNHLDFILSDNFPSFQNAWFYIVEIPTPIYLSIWLKPKIGCRYLG